MERLTERTADGILVKENYEKESLKTLYSCYGEKPNSYYSNCEEGYCAMEKLADYEDAEELGLLLRLPCKVGDIVWEINAERKRISKFVIESITIYPCNVIQFNWTLLEGICKNVAGFSKTELGITVFLTREEAKAKLKEMERESDVL